MKNQIRSVPLWKTVGSGIAYGIFVFFLNILYYYFFAASIDWETSVLRGAVLAFAMSIIFSKEHFKRK